jgi:hypothetical protein
VIVANKIYELVKNKTYTKLVLMEKTKLV